MRDLRTSDAPCIHEPRPQRHDTETHFTDEPPTVLHLCANQEYRVVDEFDDGAYVRQEDGSFVVTLRFRQDEWLCGYIQSFAPYVRVVSPEWLRKEIAARMQAAAQRNKE